MKTLFAVTYPSKDEAKAALDRLAELQKGQTITLADAVIVTRGQDGSVKLDQSMNTTAVGALSGAMWGSLVGLIFLSPLIGAAVGAAAGAASGYATDYGISDEFMTAMGQKLPGGSATLFIMAADMTPERVADAIGSPAAQVVYTNMPDDVEARFKSRIGDTGTASLPPPVDIAPM